MKENTKLPDADLEKELDQVNTLYTICVRDYFSTFGVYATATSIVLAGLGFVVNAIESPVLIAVLAAIGAYLCLQWHISITTMRDQYTHFYVRMVQLERALGLKAMLRWRDAANLARGRPAYFSEVAAEDQKFLTWSFRQIGRMWALRASSMPIIYSSFFLAIGLALGILKGWERAEEATAVTTVIWFIAGHLLVMWEIRAAHRGRSLRKEHQQSLGEGP